MLLARLWLRAGEVAQVELDNIDWRADILNVHGKGAESPCHCSMILEKRSQPILSTVGPGAFRVGNTGPRLSKLADLR